MIAEREKAHECCSAPMAAAGEAEDPPAADPPAGDWVDLNATHCSALMSNATTPTCDKSINGLSLSNRTLELIKMKKLTLPSNWFLDFFSPKSEGTAVQGCLPLLLVCLLALNRSAKKMNPS